MTGSRLFCYYGDDFTGSTDALEALAANAVPTVLFLNPPSDADMARFPDARAIGIAGESRSRSPRWMSEYLPGIFRSMRSYGAPICQYKVCSTFDSSPEWGSIGRALELGRELFETPYVPIVVAAPHLGRYVLFGSLFAAAGETIYRIDRHPTMSCHPVTPMREADLRLHLARQTNSRIALLDITALLDGHADEKLAGLLDQDTEAIVFDGVNQATLAETGRLLWKRRPAFAIGSSGLTHAMIHHWRSAGIIAPDATPGSAAAVDRMIIVSGSCSPVTAAQIRWALANGFSGIRVDPTRLDRECILRQALSELEQGRSAILYTALGPAEHNAGAGGEALGQALGQLLRELILRSGVRRVLLAGGDTSTHAVQKLGISALTFVGSTVPGAPVCRAHSETPAPNGLELILKGGQIGPDNYFEAVRRGGQ
jgi:uncharacterized protein YgbK (DUF1537 family)